MTRTPAIAAALALGAAACNLDDGSVGESELLVPEDVELHWDSSFNGAEDGLGAVVPVDIMVYDSTTGDPLGFVELEIYSEDAALLGSDEVWPIDPEECDGCSFVWDAFRDGYYEFATDLEDDLASVRMQTDADGIARVYVYVDAFPLGDGSFDPVSVQVSMEPVDESFLVVPR